MDRSSTPLDMEKLIKNAQDGLYDPHYEYTETEENGKVEQSCNRTSISSIKDMILNSGELIGGEGVSDPGMTSFDFESYLDDRGGEYIERIEFRKTR